MLLQDALTSRVLVDASQRQNAALTRSRNSCLTSHPASAACHALPSSSITCSKSDLLSIPCVPCATRPWPRTCIEKATGRAARTGILAVNSTDAYDAADDACPPVFSRPQSRHLLTKLRSRRACSVEPPPANARSTIAATRWSGTCAMPEAWHILAAAVCASLWEAGQWGTLYMA